VSNLLPNIGSAVALRLVVILSFGLALGACSKCDVPTWMANPSAPHACHDGPSPQ
jgi:hypothetical protein